MPQEFNVLRCYSCETFQVHIVKKAKKWVCKVCNEKQSIKKVYGQGSGKDCRLHVQKLNSLRMHQDQNLQNLVNIDMEGEPEHPFCGEYEGQLPSNYDEEYGGQLPSNYDEEYGGRLPSNYDKEYGGRPLSSYESTYDRARTAGVGMWDEFLERPNSQQKSSSEDSDVDMTSVRKKQPRSRKKPGRKLKGYNSVDMDKESSDGQWGEGLYEARAEGNRQEFENTFGNGMSSLGHTRNTFNSPLGFESQVFGDTLNEHGGSIKANGNKQGGKLVHVRDTWDTEQYLEGSFGVPAHSAVDLHDDSSAYNTLQENSKHVKNKKHFQNFLGNSKKLPSQWDEFVNDHESLSDDSDRHLDPLEGSTGNRISAQHFSNDQKNILNSSQNILEPNKRMRLDEHQYQHVGWSRECVDTFASGGDPDNNMRVGTQFNSCGDQNGDLWVKTKLIDFVDKPERSVHSLPKNKTCVSGSDDSGVKTKPSFTGSLYNDDDLDEVLKF